MWCDLLIGCNFYKKYYLHKQQGNEVLAMWWVLQFIFRPTVAVLQPEKNICIIMEVHRLKTYELALWKSMEKSLPEIIFSIQETTEMA